MAELSFTTCSHFVRPCWFRAALSKNAFQKLANRFVDEKNDEKPRGVARNDGWDRRENCQNEEDEKRDERDDAKEEREFVIGVVQDFRKEPSLINHFFSNVKKVRHFLI